MSGTKIWHRRCRKLSQSYMMIMTVLECSHSALPITKAVKAVTNPQSKLCAADVSICWDKSMCVYDWGKKKSIKALFGHFKLYCISVNAFLSFLNKRFFFSKVLLVKIRDWYMKNVHTFFLSNAENPVVMIQWKWTSALQNYLEKKMANKQKSTSDWNVFVFFFFYSQTQISSFLVHRSMYTF